MLDGINPLGPRNPEGPSDAPSRVCPATGAASRGESQIEVRVIPRFKEKRRMGPCSVLVAPKDITAPNLAAPALPIAVEPPAERGPFFQT